MRMPCVRPRFFGLVALAVLMAGGCTMRSASRGDITGSIAREPPRTEAQWRSEIESLAAAYRANPTDATTAARYARALRGTGQNAQAVAVLERVAMREPGNMALLGEYGRALADVGRFEQALEVLGRAHRPDQPDWRVVNTQGSILDATGKHQDAQKLYADALRIAPGEPTILSNLGLSRALSRDLTGAETVLRQAAAHPRADARIRQNLALVVGLQGRFDEAEQIARKDLPSAEAAQNVAAVRQMLSQQNTWARIREGQRRS